MLQILYKRSYFYIHHVYIEGQIQGCIFFFKSMRQHTTNNHFFIKAEMRESSLRMPSIILPLP